METAKGYNSQHTTNILRTFGLGTNILAERIQNEVTCYHLKSYAGQPVDIRKVTATSTSNIICCILTGQRYEYEDANFQNLLQHIDTFISTCPVASLFDLLPFLKLIPLDLLGQKRLTKTLNEIYREFQSFIDTSRDNDAEDNLIAAYLNEREARIHKGEDTSLDETNLLKCVFDFFLAGTETTATTICWFVLYMLYNPDCQMKIFREINEHVGTHRSPTIQDQPKLNYLNACVMETQRLANIVPMGIVRVSTRDLVIRGYSIPKGALIAFDLDSVMYDEKTWGSDARIFWPERFIDEGGQLKIPEEIIPFSAGRRICLGEVMAKTELFLYLASMCQRFQFETEELPSLDYVSGLTAKPLPFLVKLVEHVNTTVSDNKSLNMI